MLNFENTPCKAYVQLGLDASSSLLSIIRLFDFINNESAEATFDEAFQNASTRVWRVSPEARVRPLGYLLNQDLCFILFLDVLVYELLEWLS